MILLSIRATLVLAAMLATATAQAGEADTSNGVAANRTAPLSSASPPPVAQPAAETQRYCRNIAAAAAEARYVWQTRRLTELQGQVTEKITALEAKEQELRELLARRDEALKRADAALVGIYAKMKPDTAAAQLSALDDDIAAAVLQQLNPRAASAILDEIEPNRAARLVNTIAGVGQADAKAPEGKKS